MNQSGGPAVKSRFAVEPKPESSPSPIYAAALLPPDAPAIEAPGIEQGLTLRTVEIGGWCAFAGVVGLSMFMGDDAEQRLQDPAWLTPRAIAHERALLEARTHVDLLPLPFGTVFHSLDSLADRCDRHAEVLADFFARTCGASEWCIKVTASRRDAIEHEVESRLNLEVGAEASGAAYLRAQARRRAIETEVLHDLSAFADEQADRLDAIARDSSDRRQTSGEPDIETLAHWAFLVDRRESERVSELTREINHGAPSGVRFDLAGPFPPYSFTPRLS
ncbi:MAG: GvpL/GvpF family gas vesicle protein [Planctomycetota bacterium]